MIKWGALVITPIAKHNAEEIIEVNPFFRLKIPKPSRKVITTFFPSHLRLLLSVITSSAEGYRDAVIILTLLDTGLRVNELINLNMNNVWLEEGLIKVLGKGNDETLWRKGWVYRCQMLSSYS